LAFGRPEVKPKPNTTNYSGNNTALAAAVRAGRDSHAASRNISRSHTGSHADDERLVHQTTGESNEYLPNDALPQIGLVRQRLNQLVKPDASNYLQLPGSTNRSRSPSQIAASLAASRSAPTSPNHTGEQSRPVRREESVSSTSGRSQSVSRSHSVSRHVGQEDVLDTTSIPPTTSLIGMFERSTEEVLPPKKNKSPQVQLLPALLLPQFNL